MNYTKKLTLEEKIRRQLELHDRLQKAREKEKPFRVFSATDDGIHIVEGKGNEMGVIYTFKFKGYGSNGLTAIFEKTAEYGMLPPPIAGSDFYILLTQNELQRNRDRLNERDIKR